MAGFVPAIYAAAAARNSQVRGSSARLTKALERLVNPQDKASL